MLEEVFGYLAEEELLFVDGLLGAGLCAFECEGSGEVFLVCVVDLFGGFVAESAEAGRVDADEETGSVWEAFIADGESEFEFH